jgi:hypothetical protein
MKKLLSSQLFFSFSFHDAKCSSFICSGGNSPQHQMPVQFRCIFDNASMLASRTHKKAAIAAPADGHMFMILL